MTFSKQRFGKSNPGYKHGMYGTPIYRVWLSMLGRCRDVSNPVYGGRGIAVCESWHVFANFYADMGERPAAGMQIERIDNDAGYSKENCCWATAKEQGANRRTNRFLLLDGKRLIQTDVSTHLGMSRGAVAARRMCGWAEQDLAKPRMRAPHKRLSADDVQWVRDWHAAGWSQRHLAQALGTNGCRISWIVNGNNSKQAKARRAAQ